MTNTIAGTYSTLVTLGAAIDNPTTITATALLNYGLVVSYSGLAVVNAGVIADSSGFPCFGIDLRGGGSVTNQSGGTISGDWGIYAYGGVTVVNAGTITGSNDAVQFAARFANRLVIDPNAVFSGEVTGGNTIGSTVVSTLELAAGSSAGTRTSWEQHPAARGQRYEAKVRSPCRVK